MSLSQKLESRLGFLKLIFKLKISVGLFLLVQMQSLENGGTNADQEIKGTFWRNLPTHAVLISQPRVTEKNIGNP